MARGIEKLHPELQIIAKQFETNCKAAGLNVLITETLRSTEEQNALYAQGRSKPGNIVTNCNGTDYKSAHQWGVAFDFCRNEKGREFVDSDGFFGKCGAVGKKLGLTWGGDWKSIVDKPHLEYTKFLPSSSTATLKKQYGTPAKFMATWSSKENAESNKEEDEVTQKQFEEMYATMIARANGDKPSSWAKNACEAAKRANVFNGDGKGNYNWQDFITKEGVAVILSNLKLI